ncbi:hypothetical protein D8I24_1563 [Cupriavidus necator H850]|nr:hypothetical protein D8I24_1563 [Cupriavidus necator H850]
MRSAFAAQRFPEAGRHSLKPKAIRRTASPSIRPPDRTGFFHGRAPVHLAGAGSSKPSHSRGYDRAPPA